MEEHTEGKGRKAVETKWQRRAQLRAKAQCPMGVPGARSAASCLHAPEAPPPSPARSAYREAGRAARDHQLDVPRHRVLAHSRLHPCLSQLIAGLTNTEAHTSLLPKVNKRTGPNNRNRVMKYLDLPAVRHKGCAQEEQHEKAEQKLFPRTH